MSTDAQAVGESQRKRTCLPDDGSASESGSADPRCAQSSSKRLKTDATTTNSALFEIESIDTSSSERTATLIEKFQTRNPRCVQTRLTDVVENVPVDDRFVVVYVVISQGRQVIMGKKKWRFVVREALDNNNYGDQTFLTVSDYLPNDALEQLLPVEFKTRNSYKDMSSAPVLLITGFTRKADPLSQFAISFCCDSENSPRILMGLPKRHREPFFVSDFGPTTSSSLILSSPTLPAGYTYLNRLQHTQHCNLIALVTHSYHTPRTVRGGEFMFAVFICDPTLSLVNGDNIAVYIFAKNPEQFPIIQALGDVILLRNFRFYRHGGQLQLKGNIGESAFLMIPQTGTQENLTKLNHAEEAYVQHLFAWYAKEVDKMPVDRRPESAWTAPKLEEFIDGLKNGVPLVPVNRISETSPSTYHTVAWKPVIENRLPETSRELNDEVQETGKAHTDVRQVGASEGQLNVESAEGISHPTLQQIAITSRSRRARKDDISDASDSYCRII